MKQFAFVKWAFVSTTVIGLIYVLGYESKSQATQPPVAFTADYTETSSNPITGHSMQKQQLYWASKSNGDQSFGWRDQQYGWRTVRNWTKKTEITIADPQKLKTTFDYTYLPFTPKLPTYAADCRTDPGPTLLGVDTISDFKAYHYQRQQVLQDGSRIQTDTWYSPALNCYAIQSIAHKYDSDGTLTGVFEKKTTQITLGEPSNLLFSIGDDYGEVKESERNRIVLLQSVADREGSTSASQYTIPAPVRQYWNTRDQLYESVKAKQFNPSEIGSCPTCPMNK